jgi:cob(I)alamin adenosyltransferase
MQQGTDWQEGRIQVYTGNGKGKTTAALGLALRAAGRGIPVYIGQFMKGQDYGELESVQWLKTVTLEQYGDPGWVRKGRIKPQQIEAAADGLARARQAMLSGKYRIVILDEIHMAVWFELVGLDAVLELLDQRPADIELILTAVMRTRRWSRAPTLSLKCAKCGTTMKLVLARGSVLRTDNGEAAAAVKG